MSGKRGGPHPPNETRFRKGQSGNPKGRPRKPKPEPTRSAFDVVLDKTLTVSRDGVPREMTVDEALQHQTLKDALAGKRLAQRKILQMIAKRDKARAARKPREAPAAKMRIEPGDPRNAEEAMLLLQIVREDSGEINSFIKEAWGEKDEYAPRLVLAPRAVQLALGRRRGGRALTDEAIEEIKRCTYAPDTLKWPRGSGE